jgi:type IV pilus assembly protein PilY1
VTNRFYVYVDDLKVTSSSVPAPTVTSLDTTSSTGMKDCTVETDCLPSTATSCVDAGVFPTSSNKGWFMDLRGGVTGAALPGEQTVSSAVIAGGMVTFSTNRAFPTPPNTCTANLGEARGYWLNLVNASGAITVTGTCGGARSETFVGGGLPPSPVLTSVTVNGKVVNVIIGAVDRAGGASAPIQAQRIVAPVSLARHPVYWNKGGDN